MISSKEEMKRDEVMTGELTHEQQPSEDWGLILQECRRQRMHLEQDDVSNTDWVSFFNFLKVHLGGIGRQLSNYSESLSAKRNSSGGDGKEMIQSTRNALRIAISFLSIPETKCREDAQRMATDKWTDSILAILCSHRGDAKCRLFAAQLMCNLVTQNAYTARKVNSLVSFAPSISEISSSIRNMTVTQGENEDEANSCQVPVPNWVDMLLCASKSSNREALAAVTAALHNMFSSGVELSTDSLLISTILRQLISADSIKSLIKGGTLEETTDVATEWIVLLVAKYCREGLLPLLYTAASGTDAGIEKCLPEQVVLLHCVRSIIEDPTDQAMHGASILGSEKRDECNSIATYIFLSELLSVLLARTLTSTERNSMEEELSLVSSASSTIVDILAETLITDTEEMRRIRTAIGHDTELISLLCKALGEVYDEITQRNDGRKARETVIYDDEQAKLVGFVRLLGNLAFGCTHNQDAIRNTVVPFPKSQMNAASLEERSGLHVLLSCTAYSHACFTLREWAVVAIRNVLENNAANQALVEQLEAKQGVQSAVMNDMGIRVDVEPKSGKVQVIPLDKINENNEQLNDS